MLRAIAVAALLCLAAGVLLTGNDRPQADPVRTVVSAPADTVGIPLRIADAGVGDLVRAGQHVDVLGGVPPPDDGANQSPATSVVLATNVLVLRTVSGAVAGQNSGQDTTLLYLAVTPEQAIRLAGIAAGTRITVTVRSP